jgi:hypothetical protein
MPDGGWGKWAEDAEKTLGALNHHQAQSSRIVSQELTQVPFNRTILYLAASPAMGDFEAAKSISATGPSRFRIRRTPKDNKLHHAGD